MKKKLFALLLALVMVFSMAMTVSAAESDGSALSLQVSTGKGSVTVAVYLTGAENVTNGRFTVHYDAEALTLVDVQTSNVYAVDSVNDLSAGSVSLAWVGSDLSAEKTLMLTLTLEIAEGCTRDLTYTVASEGIYNAEGAVEVAGDSVTVEYNAPADTTALENAIAAAQTLNAEAYSADSFAEVEAALVQAIAVLADADATQAEIDAATKALTDAMAALRPAGSADVTKLKAAIAEAEKLSPELYTEASFSAMQSALAAAKKVLENPDATQDEVDAAANALDDAIAALVLSQPNVPSGDNSQVALWMCVLLLSLVGTVIMVVAMIRTGRSKQVCRALSMVLVAAMLLTLLPVNSMAVVLGEDNGTEKGFLSTIKDLLSGDYVVTGEDTSFIGTIKEVFNKTLNLKLDQNISSVQSNYADKDMVRVIIELEGKGLLEQGFTQNQISAYGDDVAAEVAKMKVVQDYVAAQVQQIVNASGLYNGNVAVKYNYTVALNGLAMTVPYGVLAQIRKLDNVKNAYVASDYYAPESAQSESYPSVYATSETFGAAQTWKDLGYTGAGMVIAVIDTGLDIDHPSFVDAPESPRMNIDHIASVLTELNAYDLFNENSPLAMTAEDVYFNAKVPFGFNYVDRGTDITHDYDSQGDHGTHVAGIAAANKITTTDVVGVAPDAQVVVMKVFGQSNNGASTIDILAAVEDCFLLGVDVINMSLGSPAGFTEDSPLISEIYGRVLNADMLLAVAAGNIPSAAIGNNQGSNLNYTSDPDIGIVNAPSTYLGATCVASSENGSVMMPYFAVGAEKIAYVDVTYFNFAALAGTYEYVLVPGCGDVSDYEGVDVAGRVAVVQRGNIDFVSKQKNAYDQGAIALIVYDNVEGALISMYDGGYLPNVFICKKDGDRMIAAANANGIGIIEIKAYGDLTPIGNGLGGSMSTFSAWGVTADLQLAPDVTAPGGNIYSCFTDGEYGSMSGTSMASPHIAGMGALVLQYLHDQYPGLTDEQYHIIVESLVMSTAEPAKDSNGVYYSPRNQGAGQANVYNAVTSPVYLTSYQEHTGEWTPKASFGDDPQRTGRYSFTFEMNNLTDTEQVYILEGVLMTDQYLLLDGFGDTEFFGEEDRYLTGEMDFAFPTGNGLAAYDFDGNGVTDLEDVQLVLDAVNGVAAVDGDLSLDLNKDQAIDTRDAQYLYELVLNTVTVQNRVTVPANGSVSITVSIALSEEDMAYMDAHYANGVYVEGFVRAYAETEGAVDLSLPFAGFYGAWNDAPMFDTGWYYEDVDTVEYNRYLNVLFATLGDTGGAGLGMNPYVEEEYDPAHNVLSPNGDGYYDYIPEIYISLMRSAEILDFTWTDDATGEQLFYEYYPYARKSYYWEAYGMAMPIVYTDGGLLPFTFEDENGEIMVHDLQHLTLTIRGYLDDGELDNVYVDENGVPVPDYAWADGIIEVPVVIDLAAPKIDLDTVVYFTENGRNYVRFTVSDNYDIAAIVVTTVGGGAYDYLPVEGKVPGVDGETSVVTLDITDCDSTFQVVVADYACNESYYELTNVNGSGLAEDEFYAFRRYSTVTTQDSYYTTDQLNGWYSFVDGDAMLKHTAQPSSGERTVFAAEYVDGYIFGAQAGDYDYNTLFVMKAGSWDRTDFGAYNAMNKIVYEWPDRTETYFPLKMVALDMAYDYTTDTMYILANAYENNYFPEGEVNILLSLDLNTGDVQVLGKIVAAEGEEFLALTLACDNEGVLYTANYENGKLYTINKEPVATTKNYGYGTFEATCIQQTETKYWVAAYTQSMTVDHATNTLYWAAYQGQVGVSAFLKLDKDTGEIQTLTYTADNAEMVGLFKPWDSGRDIIAEATLEGMTLRNEQLYLNVGQNATIVAKPQPYNADLGQVTYTSLDESIATVSAHGIVEAHGIGQAEILVTVTAADGSVYQDICKVNVSAVSGALFGYSDPYWLLTDAGNPQYTNQVVDAMELEGTVAAAAYRDGYIYVATLLESYDEDYNTIYVTNFYKLDATTLNGELIGSFDGKTTALAFNYADGFMYGLRYEETYDSNWNMTASYQLFRVNMRTAETITVTSLDAIYPCSDLTGDYTTCSGALAIDYEGNFYVNGDNADWEYNLVRFNLDENGWIVNVTEYVGFSEYNWSGDAMVWSERNGGLIRVSGTMLQWINVSDMENVVSVNLGTIRGASGTVLALALPLTAEPAVQGAVAQEVVVDSSYTVAEGDWIKIQPTINPWNAVGEFEYFIGDESIATVNRNGVVTGISVGQTTLTVHVIGTDLYTTTTIVVEENPGYLYGYFQANLSAAIPLEAWGKIPLSNPANYDFISDSSDVTIYAGGYYNGVIYALGQHHVDGKYYLLKVSPTNFYFNVVRECELMLRDLAFDYTTGTMYAVGYSDSVLGGLYQVDLNTLELTLVADNDLGTQLVALACDNNGKLYAADNSGEVYAVNKYTAELTSTGIYGPASQYLQSMTYDYNNDAIYWAVAGGIYQLDLAARRAVMAGTTDCSISGLFSVSKQQIHVPATVDPTGVSMPEKDTVAVGETLAVKAVVLPVSVATVDQTLTWTSSDESIALVNQNGVVTGVSAGVVTITATDAKGNSSSTTITVTAEHRYFYGYDELTMAWVKFDTNGLIQESWADDRSLSPIVAAQYIDGVLYAYDKEGYFYTVDTETFQRTLMGNGINNITISLEAWDNSHDGKAYYVDGVPYIMIDLAYSVEEGRRGTVTKMYGVMMAWHVSDWLDSFAYKIVELDMETGEITSVIIDNALVDGMSLRPTNLLYHADRLWTINGYITGMVTAVDPVFNEIYGTVICPEYWGDFNGGRSMIEDPLTGTIYAIRDMRTDYIGSGDYNDRLSTSTLVIMELGIGKIDEICTIGSNMRIIGLFIK